MKKLIRALYWDVAIGLVVLLGIIVISVHYLLT